MTDSIEFRARFEAGDVVFSEGEAGDCAYIVERGEVFVTCDHKGRMVHLATLGPGEIFGEMALIDDRARTATVTARHATECVVVRREQIQRRLAEADPITGTLLRLLLDRFRTMQSAIVDRDPAAEALRAHAPPTLPTEFADQYTQARDRLRLEQEIDVAITGGQFFFEYQPIVALTDGAIVGYEALVRWNHPERGRIAPDAFLGVAELSGLIARMDRAYLPQAMAFAKALSGRAYVSVNLSARRFAEPRLVEELADACRSLGIDPAIIQVELTESAFIAHPNVAGDILGRLKQLGFRLAVDDFGTGYSALSYLHRYPIDVIKIDKSFVQRLEEGGRRAQLARAIMGLAGALGIGAVAEGIETEAQRAILLEMGCRQAQGWLFARAAPAERWLGTGGSLG